MLGLVLKSTEKKAEAAAPLQYQNVATSSYVQNPASGPTALITSATYPTAHPVLTGLADEGPCQAGTAGGYSVALWYPSMACGVFGYTYDRNQTATAGVLGAAITDRVDSIGVLGQSRFDGRGPGIGVEGQSGAGIGVRGLIGGGSANAIAVYGLNNSNYAGPASGAGGFGVYGLSAKGHSLVGATAAPGAAAVVGATNGVAGAYAAAFYGPVLVGGDFTVFGAKSAAVPHPDGTHRLLYCVESPDSWFEDFGTAQLSCGRAEHCARSGAGHRGGPVELPRLPDRVRLRARAARQRTLPRWLHRPRRRGHREVEGASAIRGRGNVQLACGRPEARHQDGAMVARLDAAGARVSRVARAANAGGRAAASRAGQKPQVEPGLKVTS